MESLRKNHQEDLKRERERVELRVKEQLISDIKLECH